MPIRDRNIFEGMGEVLLSLAVKHCSSHEWAPWLKVILLGAAAEGDTTMVSALLKAGASCSGGRENDGVTPLHAAARGGSLGVVAVLLKTLAINDVNKKTQASGSTPLLLAVKHGHADVALALVRAGGDVNLTDNRGRSPLIRATYGARAELVNDLLLRGSHVDAKDKDGATALLIAVCSGNLDVIKVLLRAGACPGTREKNLSPVDLAVLCKRTGPLLELLAAAPNLSVLDDDGNSAMRIAVRRGNVEAINMLVDAGRNISSRDALGSPLHWACYYLQPGSVEALLRWDADEKVRNDRGKLPYDVLGIDISEKGRDKYAVGDIRKMLARAPADRAWRRRGWLAMLNARKHGADKEHRREDHGNGAEDNQHEEAEPPSILSSRRKLDDGGRWTTDDAVSVHPSLKRFHRTVTKVVDIADELIFRTIVSYL